jgi:hypothetical protein
MNHGEQYLTTAVFYKEVTQQFCDASAITLADKKGTTFQKVSSTGEFSQALCWSRCSSFKPVCGHFCHLPITMHLPGNPLLRKTSLLFPNFKNL